MQNTKVDFKEIQEKITELRKELFELRFTKPEARKKNFSSLMRNARRQIARLVTKKKGAIGK